MLKNSKVVLFATLKSWSGRKLLDPTSSAIYGEVNVPVEKCVEIKGDYVEK